MWGSCIFRRRNKVVNAPLEVSGTDISEGASTRVSILADAEANYGEIDLTRARGVISHYGILSPCALWESCLVLKKTILVHNLRCSSYRYVSQKEHTCGAQYATKTTNRPTPPPPSGLIFRAISKGASKVVSTFADAEYFGEKLLLLQHAGLKNTQRP